MIKAIVKIAENIKDIAEKANLKETTKSLETKESVLLQASPVINTLDEINNLSFETLKLQNEKTIKESKVKQLAENRENGKSREDIALKKLQEEYKEEDGYRIYREAYLRDINGNLVKDIKTGEGRRIDFVVDKNGEVVKSVEVTSKTASKEEQIAKEQRIRANGGNYIKDSETGKLIEIPENITTEIRRYR